MASGTSSKKAPVDTITTISSSALALMSTAMTVRILKKHLECVKHKNDPN